MGADVMNDDDDDDANNHDDEVYMINDDAVDDRCKVQEVAWAVFDSAGKQVVAGLTNTCQQVLISVPSSLSLRYLLSTLYITPYFHL